MVASSIRWGCSVGVVTALILCAVLSRDNVPPREYRVAATRRRFSNDVSSVTELSRYISPAFSEALHLLNRCTVRVRGHLSFRCRTSATAICYLLGLIPDSEDCAKSEWRLDVEPGDRSPRRRRGPGRGGDERAPERLRRAAPRPGTPPDRRAVALGAVGFPGRERARLARPVPRPRVRRSRPRWFRLQGAGRGLLRRLRGEDRGADPLRRRGDVRAQERPARLPRGRRRPESSTRATSSPRPARSSVR